MSDKFTYFVVLAEMRTGSNFLESNLNAFDGLICHGEAFNPFFIGYPNKDDLLGITLDAREEDPDQLLDLIRASHQETGVLAGFRYFSDHDTRVRDTVLDDPACAKIVLTRNPVDSYVSWRIAQNTGQWKLTNVKRRKVASMRFDAEEFSSYISALQDMQVKLLNRLQRSGQTAFYISYDDLGDLDVINGLARFLGLTETRDEISQDLKPQNPGPLSDKVENFDEMQQALAQFDRFDLTRTPNFEPRRGRVVPTMITAAQAPLMYMPIPSAAKPQVTAWLAALDGVSGEDLGTRLNQSQMRRWFDDTPGHLKFTVISHPVARAHRCFCAKILNTGPGGFLAIRKRLRNFYKLPLPGDAARDYSADDHRTAFKAFLRFLAQNLNGQTSIRVDGHWASQLAVLQGMAEFTLPDFVIRETDLKVELGMLGARIGRTEVPAVADAPAETPFALDQIYDDEIEDLTRTVYRQDYQMFGFTDWALPSR